MINKEENLYFLYDIAVRSLLSKSGLGRGISIVDLERFVRRFLWFYQEQEKNLLGFILHREEAQKYKLFLAYEKFKAEFRAPWVHALGSLFAEFHDFEKDLLVTQNQLNQMIKQIQEPEEEEE